MPLLSALSSVRDRLTPYQAPINSSGAEVVTSDGRSLPLLGAKLVGEAKGGIARLVLEQTFANRYDETLHVTYRMPLPADGAVSGYAFQIAGRTITGKVDRKQEAREQFERAVAEGKTAGLLEQNRDDIFTQEIGNLPAGQTLVARITVDQKLAWLPEGEWELRFPTVIGPRYISSTDATEKDARDTAIAVAPGGVSARIQIQIAIGDRLVAGRKASSPSHPIAKDDDGRLELDISGLASSANISGLASSANNSGLASSANNSAALDRDIVVRWPVATREVGLALDVARKGDHSYGLLTIVPPSRDAKSVALPRDLIVLFDTSGSMGGAPIEKARHTISMLIESLGELDRLEVIEFSMQTRRWPMCEDGPVSATEAAKRDAIKWVRSREASGGTEMASALRESLTSLRIGAQRQVVLVTDGYVGGEQQIVKLLHDKLPKSCRLHVLGIGSAVNRSLATALARAGRGAEVLVGLDEDIERGTKRLVDRMKAPVLTNVEISGSALVRCAPEHAPDVFEGAPVVAGIALSPEGGELVVSGELAHGVGEHRVGHPYRVSTEKWIQRITVPPKRAGEGNQAIAALYARELVADLEMRIAGAIGDTGKLDREIESIGVELQISTRLTSWVAIDHDSHVGGPSRHEVQPQALPYGTSAGSFGLRGGGGQLFGISGFEVAGAMASMPAMSSKTMMGAAPPAPGAPPVLAGKRADVSYKRSSAPMLQVQSLDQEKTTGVFAQLESAPLKGRPSRMPVFLMLVLLLAVIAFLVWWLVL